MADFARLIVLALCIQYAFAVQVVRVGIQFPWPVGIDYHQATNTILMSKNYPTGVPNNFVRLEFDAKEVTYSNIGSLTDEVKISCVREGNRGGFLTGECFTGNGNSGHLTRISPDGTNVISPWVILPGNPGLLRGSIYVDPYQSGSFGGNIAVVTTYGHAFVVKNDKTVTFMGKTPTTTHLEGLLIVPDNPTAYGAIADRMIAGAEDYSLPRENRRHKIWIFGFNSNSQPLTPASYPISVAIEDIDMVFPNENFFGVNYKEQRLIGAAASEWVPYVNKIILTQEFEWTDGSTGLYTLDWNNGPVVTKIPIDSSRLPANQPITQWEHITFAKAGILEIPPADPICYLWRDHGNSFNLHPIVLPNTVIEFYNYNSNTRPFSSNFFGEENPSINSVSLSNRLTVIPVIDHQNLISIIIHADEATDNSAGSVEVKITNSGYQPSIGALLKVQDDSGSNLGGVDFQDSFSWASGAGYFSFEWGATTSDGAVISPLLVAGLNQGICFTLEIINPNGIDALQVPYRDSNNNLQVHIVAVSGDSDKFLLCVYDCAKLCFLFDECTGCAASNCTWCDSTSKCLQTGSQDANTCATSYSGYSCPCDRYGESCSKCSENPTCGWCCEDGGLSGECISGTSESANDTCSGTWKYHSCTGTCAEPCARGACVCGVCQCPPTWTGPRCDIKIGCDGLANSGKVIDVCGICGGDGTSCLGCENPPVPFGQKYDVCGVCGGDGRSCFEVCPFPDCNACARVTEFCQWCVDANGVGDCIVKGLENCTGHIVTDVNGDECQNRVLNPAELAGTISAAIIAVIIIAIVVCLILSAIGGTKAYQLYMSNKRQMGVAQTNPMYLESKNQGSNPMFEDH